MPIYRSRDGGDTKAKNEKIMAECIEMLEDGRQPIAIFVEGNHGMKRSLRPLKKGAARIAFQALEKTNFKRSLKIIPVGVNYSKHSSFRGDLLVNWGDPILVNNYQEVFEANPNKAYIDLTEDIQRSLEPLVVNIPDDEHYQEIEKAWIAKRQKQDSMYDELQNDRKIINKLVEEKNQGMQLETEVQQKQRKTWAMILGFLPFIYGTLNHLPTVLLVRRVVDNYVTDIHFYSSIKLVGGMYLGMLFYIRQTIGVYALTGGNFIIATIYLLSLPFFGIFAYDHYLQYYTDEPEVTSSAELLKNYR
jgi:hypothetical protein